MSGADVFEQASELVAEARRMPALERTQHVRDVFRGASDEAKEAIVIALAGALTASPPLLIGSTLYHGASA